MAHKYLTEEAARKLKPGDKLKVGWDDFNRGKETCFVIGETKKAGPQALYIELETREKGEEPFRWVIYSFAGPHRDGTRESIMCKGSGCERIKITK